MLIWLHIDFNHQIYWIVFRYKLNLKFTLFLVRINGTTGNYGILEVMVAGVWNVVCDTDFDEKAAKVFCKQLSYADGNFQPGILELNNSIFNMSQTYSKEINNNMAQPLLPAKIPWLVRYWRGKPVVSLGPEVQCIF